jgi:hypothetical protein
MKGKNIFKNYEEAEQEKVQSIINLYACTASGKPQLLLSSAKGANLNSKSRFVVYSQDDDDNKTTVKLLIETPSVVRTSQIYTL